MRCMLPWELRRVLGGNRSESGIIILYSASEQGYLVLALYKHALLYIYYIGTGYRLYIYIYPVIFFVLKRIPTVHKDEDLQLVMFYP